MSSIEWVEEVARTKWVSHHNLYEVERCENDLWAAGLVGDRDLFFSKREAFSFCELLEKRSLEND